MNCSDWLSKPPKYTTFRINNLKTFDINCLQKFLENQKIELGQDIDLPNFYLLKPDCLLIAQWPDSFKFEKSEHEVIVDALCAAAVLRGAHVFAPGVMGLPSNCQLGERIDIYGDLEGKCKRGLKTTYLGKKLYVGTGHLKMLRSDLFDNGIQPSGIAVHTLMPASRLPVINESICSEGVLVLQNLPSIVCGWVVDAKPGENILDMCSAPGNKTTHLGEMSNNKAYITAIDKTLQKVEKVKRNCMIQGITCCNAYVFDSTNACSEDGKMTNKEPPFAPNSFDKILLDAPCSGLGQRPLLHNKMTPKMLESYKFVQRKLFDAATKLLKPGGILVYSTCTTTEDENERMVAWVLEKHPCMKLVPSYPLLGGPGLSECGLDSDERLLVQRFGPHHDSFNQVEDIYKDTIGFFIAKFKKI